MLLLSSDSLDDVAQIYSKYADLDGKTISCLMWLINLIRSN